MPTPFPHAPGGSQRGQTATLLDLLRQLSDSKAPAAGPVFGTGEIRSELLKQIVRATFADDERGKRLREAWRMVGAGLTLLLREFADHATTTEE